VLEVVPREELAGVARRIAGDIAAKSGTVIRAAKQSLNGIDPVDVKRSYRYEQGFTFELNLAGVADEARDAFVQTGKPADFGGGPGATPGPPGAPAPSGGRDRR
jgi:enoyl-CoA hydratase